jgi:hypothetical protein
LLPEALHFQGLWHRFQKMFNLFSPEKILWVDLAGSGVLLFRRLTGLTMALFFDRRLDIAVS